MEEMTQQLQGLFQNLHQGRSKRRKLKVKDALKLLKEEEAGKLIDQEDVKLQAVRAVEENGIVFIDEIDKIARRAEAHGADVSREGVQRDLLPLVEGCTVSTRYGMVRTDHVLFIASGAFTVAKPADLIPELQGRFPIRVELTSLGVDEFVRILTEPSASLTEQYMSLLATERFELKFEPSGVRRLAEVAFEVLFGQQALRPGLLAPVVLDAAQLALEVLGAGGPQEVLNDGAQGLAFRARKLLGHLGELRRQGNGLLDGCGHGAAPGQAV